MKIAKISIDDLAFIVNYMKREYDHGCFCGAVKLYVDGDEIVMEQPCGYAECNSHYERFRLEETED